MKGERKGKTGVSLVPSASAGKEPWGLVEISTPAGGLRTLPRCRHTQTLTNMGTLHNYTLSHVGISLCLDTCTCPHKQMCTQNEFPSEENISIMCFSVASQHLLSVGIF